MVNIDSPFGLKPVMNMDGSPWNGATVRCYVPATDGTAIFVGDPVIWNGESSPDGTCPQCIRATVGATNKIFGVVTSFAVEPTNLTYNYRPASTARYFNVALATSAIFEIQASSAAALTTGSIGLNGVLIATHSGSTTTGLSGIELSTTTAPAADATYQVTILGASPRPDNDITALHAKVLVTINLPSVFPGIAGV